MAVKLLATKKQRERMKRNERISLYYSQGLQMGGQHHAIVEDLATQFKLCTATIRQVVTSS